MKHMRRRKLLSLRAAMLSAVMACVALAGVLSLVSASSSGQGAAQPATGSSLIIEIPIDDVIHPILAEYVANGIDEAARRKAQLVLITMNTPGGLDSAMRDIIHRIITSPVPVVVYVTPSGRRAASAGFYILLSADVAAMSPGTDTGAASPIFMIGGQTVQIDETLKKKAFNESSAYLRSITEKRGRNVELAEKAVTEAKAFTDREALDGKLIDIVAPNTQDLLQKLDGRVIKRFDGRQETLRLENPSFARQEMDRRQKFLSEISQPDVIFILIILALLGIYMEFSNPGLILPGTVGVVALVLVLVASQTLPINALGVLLIIGAVVFFILEAKFTSHGALGLAGVLCMVVGAMLLIRSPITGWGVRPLTALVVVLPFAAITIGLMRRVLALRGQKSSVGQDQLIGATGEVREAIAAPGPDGTLLGVAFVQGELWRVASKAPVPQGAQIRVLRVAGLTLHVEPVPAPASSAPSGAAPPAA